ncbi:GM14316 [Drosophila sechellia]|uniref:GM14316 n=1 Tax=Drosophila sechellia TaxID=7238 RepID=B4HVC4_DROSE|nr:GM14316 [Drosophila sechellia]
MMISDSQKKGLRELLLNDNNLTVLLQLAKCATKNVCKTEDPEEALRLITTHIPDIYVLLSKRAITKELLFTYLSNRRADAATDFSKADLIEKVIQYWKQEHQSSIELSGDQTSSSLHNQSEEDYPIHKIARKFGEWFFERFNADALSLVDLWVDATLHLTIRASDGINEWECTTAAEVLSALTSAKQQFDFYFNPNLTHAGIQGRMDSYGQFLVICCGTLHSRDSCVGIFECAFGLLRDPLADNNWKPKKVKCLLKSEAQPPAPYLCSSEILHTALELPVSTDDLN